MGRGFASGCLALCVWACAGAVQAVDLERFVKRDAFERVSISPTGEFLAVTIPMEDRTGLFILNRDGNQVVGRFVMGRNSHVDAFSWVNEERVVLSVFEKIGMLAQPRTRGELYAINADGTGAEILVGQRVQDGGLGTRIQPKKAEAVYAWLVDDLVDDDRHVIIGVSPFTADPYTRADRLDVYTGRRQQVARAPVRNATFVTDNSGVVRMASGFGTDMRRRLYHRENDAAEWELIHTAGDDGLERMPVGFSEDNRIVYLQVERASGPDALVGYDTVDRSESIVLADDTVDPASIIYKHNTSVPVGAMFMDGEARNGFIDESSSEARLYKSLQAAFKGLSVEITSSTDDGRFALIRTWSDRSAGDFYLFDIENKTADHLLSQKAWFDPGAMAGKRPIQLEARDGMPLHGYLTLPPSADGNVPLVVMPHGGPFGVQDTWEFDSDVQMLAAAGYGVLQVNFRGSSGYGRAHTDAGAREWGGAMQDDLTDATRWAISEGIGDANRVCIYGASYGGYAALMGVAKEPDLYRCAVGYVGVYDLPTMHTHGDIQERGSGETYLREWIGERESLAAVSPNRMADRIKVPVFLAAGGEDERAPIAHSEMMERALKQAGVPVETLYFANEGHGFYLEKNRREYYTRLLAFLARHLGGRTASTPAGGADVAE